jgi:hypothetical protein
MKDLDIQDLLGYARAAVGVLRTLQRAQGEPAALRRCNHAKISWLSTDGRTARG